MSEQEQMKLDMVKNLALLLMDDNPQLSIEQALATVINSDTYQRLQRDATINNYLFCHSRKKHYLCSGNKQQNQPTI